MGTISVTFTDEIDAYTNHSSDNCSSNHGERTAVIDLLPFSGSSQCNNDGFDVQNKNHCPPENVKSCNVDPHLNENNKGDVSIGNGVLPNRVVHDVKHTCSSYSEIDKKHYDTISTVPSRTSIPSHQHLILNSNRRDSKKSITLNHRYREDDGGHGKELKVYRYDGWQSGLYHTSSNGTKSTLV